MHAHSNFETAVGREAHRRLFEPRGEGVARGSEQSGAVRGHLDVIGKTDADQPFGILGVFLPNPYG